MKSVDSNIIYNLDFVLKDKNNYDFPCKFTSIQFVEIEPLNMKMNPLKKVHFNQIKNIISAMNNKDLNIPYKYSTIGKLVSKNFRENCTRMVFGDFRGVGMTVTKKLDKFKKFIKIIKDLKPEFSEKRMINSNINIKGFSLNNFKKAK